MTDNKHITEVAGRRFETPILLIVFKRPNTTQQVFNAIRQQQPKYLYVAADGPRQDKDGERELCEQARAIIKQIDWDCEVKTLFREHNIGVGKSITEAIAWFFENEEMGIILEDDCVPHQDFFPYCAELLVKYKDDPRVMVISGSNSTGKMNLGGDASYYFFSKYFLTWGWACWRKTWMDYSLTLDDYTIKEYRKIVKNKFSSWSERMARMDRFERFKMGDLNEMIAWDGQFVFYMHRKNALSIVPNVNLITNIGIGKDATNTFKITKNNNSWPTAKIMPLRHPDKITINEVAETYYFQHFIKKSFYATIYRYVRRTIIKLLRYK
ncbi:hemolytic protein HlpA [Bacteroidia bacterium]|nr:hemolytic protein HlpA [Bacteroidia bacterium]